MKLLVLAAGYATRLEPLTLKTSKSLLPIGGRKILDRILDRVSCLKDISYIYLVSNAKFFNNFNEWLEASEYKNRMSILNDGTVSNETRLGAIRDIDFAIRQCDIDDDLLVIAGDNLFEFSMDEFMKFAKDHNEGLSVAIRDIGDINSARNFGVVKIDNNCRVVDFEEKPTQPKSTLISTGIYYFPKKMLSFLKEYVKMQDKLDAPGYYIGWMSRNSKVYGFTFQEGWYDIGNMDSYKKADKEYLEKERNR